MTQPQTKNELTQADSDYLQEQAALYLASETVSFQEAIKRGQIAQAVKDAKAVLFGVWCNEYLKRSRQTVNNYAALARAFANQPPKDVDRFKLSALYKLAELESLGARQVALQWIDNNLPDDDPVDRELAVIAGHAPQYIKDLLANSDIDKSQAYQITIVYKSIVNSTSERLKAVYAICMKRHVKHAAVISYLIQIARRAGSSDNLYQVMQGSHLGDWRFVWTAHDDDYDVDIADADGVTIERYKDYRYWLRRQRDDQARDEQTKRQFVTGEIVKTVRVIGGQAVLALPQDVLEQVDNGYLDIEITYKVRRKMGKKSKRKNKQQERNSALQLSAKYIHESGMLDTNLICYGAHEVDEIVPTGKGNSDDNPVWSIVLKAGQIVEIDPYKLLNVLGKRTGGKPSKYRNKRVYCYEDDPTTKYPSKNAAKVAYEQRPAHLMNGAKLLHFASTREHEYYLVLRAKGEPFVNDLELQVKFDLIDPQTVCDEKIKITYVADFVYTDAGGTKIIVDVKGVETQMFKVKRKLFYVRFADELEAGAWQFQIVK